MSKMSSPSGSGTSSPAIDDANGYLLLTIPHTTVKQLYVGETMVLARGELRLECVSVPIPSEIGKQTANPFSPSPSDPPVPTHDFWLVVRVGPTFEMPLIPSQAIQPGPKQPDGISYTIPSPNLSHASLIITLPKPNSQNDMEDLDSFEVLLRQYGNLDAESTALGDIVVPSLGSEAKLAEDLRGRLVLVNEDNGEVVGELDQTLSIEEDRKVAMDQKDQPVLLDFGASIKGYAGRTVTVKSVPEDEMDDWMLKGAHHISKGILSFSNWSQRVITSGTTNYVKNTTPRAEPVKFHPAAKASIRGLHSGTVKTMNVTKSTMNVINNAISTVVEKTYEHGVQPSVDYTRENVYEPLRRGSLDYTQSQFLPMIRETVRRGSQVLEGRPPLPPRKQITSGTGNSTLSESATASPSSSSRVGTPVSGICPANIIGEKMKLPPKEEAQLAEIEARAILEQDQLDPPPAYVPPSTTKSPPPPVPIKPAALRAPATPSSVTSSPASTPIQTPTTASPASGKKRRFLSRVVLAGEVILTSLEATASDLITTGTAAASTAAGHKYGPDAGHATALIGGSVRNVAVVYVDIRGVGRRALLKSTAKGFVKTRLTSGETVTLQGDSVKAIENGHVGEEVDVPVGEVEERGDGLVIGMGEVGISEKRNERGGLVGGGR